MVGYIPNEIELETKEGNEEEIYGAWDSTCECCGFHYYNAEGDGPMSSSHNHGSNGWKTEYELKDDLLEGFSFFAPVLTAMQNKKWEVICGECVDELVEDDGDEN